MFVNTEREPKSILIVMTAQGLPCLYVILLVICQTENQEALGGSVNPQPRLELQSSFKRGYSSEEIIRSPLRPYPLKWRVSISISTVNN